MSDLFGVNLQQTASTRDTATFSVAIDGNDAGNVTFVKSYEPALEQLGQFVALWAGSILCVINRHRSAMSCLDRGDETHHVRPFENLWIVEGELQIDLFDPASAATLATYNHHEVITECQLSEGLLHIRDFAGRIISLDPHQSLKVVRQESSSRE